MSEHALVRSCLDQDFPLVGIVDLDLASNEYQAHLGRYRQWLAEGRHGDMNYLLRGLERKSNPRLLFPQAQSVICVASPYAATPLGSANGPRYARYMRGKDYHEEIKERLTAAMQAATLKFPDLEYKICVDTSAVLERTWGALTGIGWIGKNTLLINPKWGSYFLLGVVFTNIVTHVPPKPLANFCGRCDRCLKGCPTQAIDTHLGLDSRKCISYWTLEKRGDLSLSQQQLSKISPWIAGCDLCQEVCPFNQKRTRSEANNDVTDTFWEYSWAQLEELDEEHYRQLTKNIAVNRVKYSDFKRNLRLAKPH